MMLDCSRAEQIPVVLSSAFLRVLATALTKKDSYLHPIAHPTLQLLESLGGGMADTEATSHDGASSAVRVAVAVALQKPAGRGLALPGLPGSKLARRVLQVPCCIWQYYCRYGCGMLVMHCASLRV